MKNKLIIASPNEERILSWKQELKGFISTFVIADDLKVLWDEVVRIEPDILLLDIEMLGSKSRSFEDKLGKFCKKTSVIISCGDIPEDMEWELLKAGARGCCQRQLDSKLVKQVILAVHHGELWIRRTLTSRIVAELGEITAKNKVYRESNELLNKLTMREYDIAFHVGQGLSNKAIAQSCAITERTVKAHLSEIFQKLGISDRINLALIITADNLHQRNVSNQRH
jgi:DNA-binding NarL/FixJ family response regulator